MHMIKKIYFRMREIKVLKRDTFFNIIVYIMMIITLISLIIGTNLFENLGQYTILDIVSLSLLFLIIYISKKKQEFLPSAKNAFVFYIYIQVVILILDPRNSVSDATVLTMGPPIVAFTFLNYKKRGWIATFMYVSIILLLSLFTTWKNSNVEQIILALSSQMVLLFLMSMLVFERRIEIEKSNRVENEFQLEKERANAAEQANLNKSAFLADMSHELRNPMNAIMGFTNYLDKVGELNEIQRHYRSIVMEKSEYLIHLMNRFLQLQKIESGRFDIVPEPIDIRDIVTDIIYEDVRIVSKTNLKINFEYNDEIPHVFADGAVINQILVNLISNAIKFTDIGVINIHLEQRDDKLLISVKDTGCGIPPEGLERIFDRYQQADVEHQSKGTGLGLAISKGLVEMHGGRMWVESAVGVGSTFFFTLPLARESQAV